MNKGISIIICCYNSAERLLETVKHIALQKINEAIPCELIIVNNASTDNTEERAKTEWEKYPAAKTKFSIVHEPQAGLIYARSKGVSVAQHEYIIFCDDDNWLQEDYLQTAYDLMETMPNVGALGGQGEGVTDGDFPEWWEREKLGYAAGKQAKISSIVNKRGYLWGAGLVSRKKILDRVFGDKYPFLLTGRAGGAIISGDDSEICSRILLLEYDLYYSEKLHYQHFIASNRLTDNYLHKIKNSFEGNFAHIVEKYRLAIEFINYSRIKKVGILFFRLYSLLVSGFNKRKMYLWRVYVYFLFGVKFSEDNDLKIIRQYIKKL